MRRGGRRPLWLVLLPVLIGVIVLAVTWFGSEEQRVPVTGREQRVGLSDEQQMELGAQVYQQTLQETAPLIVTSGPEFERVQEVASRLAAVGADDKPDFAWEFTLVDDPQANAFALPGGKIVVYTGLLDVAQTDAQLATVIGHEVAHATAEHGAERIFQQQLTDTAISAAAGALASDPAQFQQIAALIGAGAQVGFTLPWSREHESEADRIGLIYMARAGYDPREAVTFWEQMEAASAEQGRPPEYLSTHPNPDTRIQQIQEWLPEALEEYEPTS